MDLLFLRFKKWQGVGWVWGGCRPLIGQEMDMMTLPALSRVRDPESDFHTFSHFPKSPFTMEALEASGQSEDITKVIGVLS